MPDPAREEEERRRREAKAVRALLASQGGSLTSDERAFSASPVARSLGAQDATAPSVEIGRARIENPVAAAIGEAAARDTDPERLQREDAAQRERVRRREAAQAALRRHRERERAYERSTREGVEGDIMGMSNAADAFQSGGAQGLTLSLADELYGLYRAGGPIGIAARLGHAVVSGSDHPVDDATREYVEARDAVRAEDDARREAEPGWHSFGRAVGSLAPGLAIPGGAASTLTGRVLQAGGMGAGFSGLEAFGQSRGDARTQLLDTLGGTAAGFTMGAVGQLGTEAVGGAADWLRSQRGSNAEPQYTPEQLDRIRQDPAIRTLEDERRQAAIEAARHRVQSTAPGSTRADLERALDGMGPDTDQAALNMARRMEAEGITRPDERSFGIVPEAADEAQRRARFMREDAGRRIGETDAEMASRARFDPERVQLDDDGLITNPYDLHLPEGERLRRAIRDQGPPVGEGPSAEATSASPRGRRRPEGWTPPRRESGGIEWYEPIDGPRPDPAGQADRALEVRRDIASRRFAEEVNPAAVDLAATAQRLRTSARALRATLDPRAASQAAELEALADSFSTAGRVPFDAPETVPSARGVLDRQTENARFGGASPDASRPYAADQARMVRRDVRGEMDRAIERTLPPEQAARHMADREQYQLATAVDDLGRMGRGRATSNRQITLSDNINVANEPTLRGKVGALIANRFIRGREHAFMAQIGEARARRLAGDIAERLMSAGERRAATALLASRNRGVPAISQALRLVMERPDGDALVGEAAQGVAPEAVQMEREDTQRMQDLVSPGATGAPQDEADIEAEDEARLQDLL